MLNEERTFESKEQALAYDALIKELRCVTCPNQSIADSSAPIAKAMQDEIYLRIKAHDSKTEIRESLISHYGEYISYNPSINHQTYALWFGPLLMLMIGSIAWLLIKRRR